MGRHQRRRHGVAVEIYALAERTDRRGNVQAAPDMAAPAVTLRAARVGHEMADVEAAGQLQGARVTLHLDPHEALQPGALVVLGDGTSWDVESVKNYSQAPRALRHVEVGCRRRQTQG